MRLLICAVLLLAACPAPPAPGPVTPPPAPAYDGGACASTPTICAYCARMRALGCPEAQATPSGKSCEVVTENTQAVPYAAMDLTCRIGAGDCASANRCR